MKLFNLDTLTPQLVSIDEINPAAFQPQSRTTKKALKELEKDILENGIVYPIVIDADGGLIDGHRRFSVLVKHGAKEVPCLILQADQAERFAAINGTVRRMSGLDAQETYLSDPSALMPQQRKNMKRAEDYIGREYFAEIVNGRKASVTSVANEARRVQSYVHNNLPTFSDPYSTEDWARAVQAFGQRKTRDLLSNDDLTPQGRSKRLLLELFDLEVSS